MKIISSLSPYKQPILLWLTLLLATLLWLSSVQYQENRTAFYQLANQIHTNTQHRTHANEVILSTLSALVGPSDLFRHERLESTIDALIEHHPQIRAVMIFPSLSHYEQAELIEQYRKHQDPTFSLPSDPAALDWRSPILFFQPQADESLNLLGVDARAIEALKRTINTPIGDHPLASRPYILDNKSYYFLLDSAKRPLTLEDELFPWYPELHIALLIDPNQVVQHSSMVNTSLLLHGPTLQETQLLCSNRNSAIAPPSFTSHHLQHKVLLDSMSQPFLLEVSTTIALIQLPAAQLLLIVTASLLYFYLSHRRITTEAAARKRQRKSEKRLLLNTKNRIQMLNAISHDIRTPLTRLQLRTAAMLKGEPQQKSLADLREIEHLVESSLGYLRDEERHEEPELTDLNTMSHTLQADMSVQNQLFTIQGEARWPYLCQPLQIKRAIQNLLNNAFRFADSVELRLHDHNRTLTIEVVDNGPGLDDALLKMVTNPYFRADDSRNKESGGIGLGLSIVREVAEAHDGMLTLTNRTNGGLKAAISLPR